MALSKISTPIYLAQDRQPSIVDRYRQVRAASEAICAPLEIEDYGIQTMLDVSPPKWHLAHVTWFFETFLLKPFLHDYVEFHPQFSYLFNSYYETVGSFHPRPERGLLSRPTVREIYAYRTHVDTAMERLLSDARVDVDTDIQQRALLGLHHEQQHQELLITDIKHIFASNPLRPAYHDQAVPRRQAPAFAWCDFPSGVYAIGHTGDGFGFDNEFPRHKVFLNGFRLASRPVSNQEYMAFVNAGGYWQVDLWLSEAWKHLCDNNWAAPFYWERSEGEWRQMTLSGLQALDPDAPVTHISYYEADAYARWRGKRLPTEEEWEVAAAQAASQGNFSDSGNLQPIAGEGDGLIQMFGDVWEWTRSAYTAYPGYRPLSGSLGEYNGKFMCGQMVLRGGSCATPKDHVRASYRNFFHPQDRWQFSGLRLAEDL
ncbi:MAG: ergothioneine biosynthesis protein EgtB [Gammaproteobacteria bacterium]